MKSVFSSLNIVEMHHLKNLLQAEGIHCHIRNEHLVRLAGEVPFPECALQLVVERDEDFEQADSIVREMSRPPRRTGPPWQCQRCGESIEGQFTACWSCGAERE